MFKRKPKKKSDLDKILDAWDDCKDTKGQFSDQKVRTFLMHNAPELYWGLCWASAYRSAKDELGRKMRRRLDKG